MDSTATYGTLHIPAHQSGRRLSAALLLPGSGPTDRNGNQPPTLTPGTADPQVPCDTTQALTTALRRARTRGPGRVILADVGHNLSTADHPGVTAPSALAALRSLRR